MTTKMKTPEEGQTVELTLPGGKTHSAVVVNHIDLEASQSGHVADIADTGRDYTDNGVIRLWCTDYREGPYDRGIEYRFNHKDGYWVDVNGMEIVA